MSGPRLAARGSQSAHRRPHGAGLARHPTLNPCLLRRPRSRLPRRPLDWTPARRTRAARPLQVPPAGARRCRIHRCGCAPPSSLLLAGTALLYLWNLSASGYSNSFYAAAVQAGTKSWKAWFFGSLDAGNSITVDKPPGVAVGHGPVGAGLRLQQLEPAGSAGAGGRRRGRAALRDGQALGGPGRRSARRRDPRADPGRGADVPLRQPRRAARPADGRRRVRDDPGHRGRPAALGAARRLPRSASPSSPRICRASCRCRPSRSRTWWPHRRRCGKRIGHVLAGGARCRRQRRLVGGGRRAVAQVVAALHRRLDQQQRARSRLRLQRLRPPHRQ